MTTLQDPPEVQHPVVRYEEPQPSDRDPDVVDRLLGPAAAVVAVLRQARPEVITHTAGASLALFGASGAGGRLEAAEPADGGGLGRSDRLAIALRVAAVSGAHAAAAHYRTGLEPLLAERVITGRVEDRRLAAILKHADLLTVRPSAATPEHHAALAAAALTVDDIVTLSQLVAFVSYQIRVVAGLSVIAAAGQDGSAEERGSDQGSVTEEGERV
jgi:hypothetical protein